MMRKLRTMVDVNRIRERAADWLGDVGDAALGRLNDLVRVVRGGEVAFERHGDSDDEIRARIKAALARGEPCPGPHQDFEPCDLCADAPPDEDAATDPAGPVDMQRMQEEIAEGAGGVRSVEPGPWRGLEHRVVHALRDWHSVVQGPDCAVYHATFSGHLAEERAREYAAMVSAPLPCTPATDPTEPTINQARAALDLSPLDAGNVTLQRYVSERPSGKPTAVYPGHRWTCVGIDGELEVSGVVRGAADVVSLRRDGAHKADVVARAADMLGLKEWRFLG